MIDNLILISDTGCVKSNQHQPDQGNNESESVWTKTPFANLVRYNPSGTYFARIRVNGKLVRKSLKTRSISVAKLRLGDLEKAERKKAEATSAVEAGKMTFGDALGEYRRRLAERVEAGEDCKPSLLKYREETIAVIVRTWPDIESLPVNRITEKECEAWGNRLRGEYSGHRFNNTVGTLRQILDIAVRAGNLYRNPAKAIKKSKIRTTAPVIPSHEQFDRFVEEMRQGHSRDSRNCADLVQFLAFSGCRISEAASVTWGDCDFQAGRITVRGDARTGTKNWETRQVPMIDDMRKLLERLKTERGAVPQTSAVMLVRECQKSMDRAAEKVGMERITHHDLRHLFATRCVESGVDIPTVSRWLGHKDGGVLAMRVYGHLTDDHSTRMAKRVQFSKPSGSNIIPMDTAATA